MAGPRRLQSLIDTIYRELNLQDPLPEECQLGPLWFHKTISAYSPGGMHETSARAWCTGKTQRNRVEREVGGGIGMGNTCNSMADSCQGMTKPTAIL